MRPAELTEVQYLSFQTSKLYGWPLFFYKKAWTGIFAKSLTTDDNPSTNIIEQMESELAREKMEVDLQKRTMGNALGLSYLNQLQDVLRELQDVKEAQKKSEEKWGERQALMDKQLKELRQINSRASTTMETIRLFSPREPDHITKWKSVFQRSYGMPLKHLGPQSNTLPDVFVEGLEKRASVHWLRRWNRHENNCMYYEEWECLPSREKKS